MEHAHHADAAADESGIESQLLQGLGGSAKENVVERLLIAARKGSELSRQSEGHEEVSDRQQDPAVAQRATGW